MVVCLREVSRVLSLMSAPGYRGCSQAAPSRRELPVLASPVLGSQLCTVRLELWFNKYFINLAISLIPMRFLRTCIPVFLEKYYIGVSGSPPSPQSSGGYAEEEAGRVEEPEATDDSKETFSRYSRADAGGNSQRS